jgi:hypothetical protein
VYYACRFSTANDDYYRNDFRNGVFEARGGYRVNQTTSIEAFIEGAPD